MLRSVDWQLDTDVSGQPIGPISNSHAVFEVTLRNDEAEQRSLSHHSGNSQSDDITLRFITPCNSFNFPVTSSSCNKNRAILENVINGMTFVKTVYASQAHTINRLKNIKRKILNTEPLAPIS
jgi:hypothetical protein